MPLYSCLVSAVLIGQAGGPTTVVVPPPASLQPRTIPGDGARSTGSSRNANEVPPRTSARATPEQLAAEAMTMPSGGQLSGQPLSLASALAAVAERPRQLEAVHAYWRLVQAVGDYHYLLERQQRLARLAAAADESGDLRAAQAVAAARLREAEIPVATAQHELAAALRLADSAPLPWPADRPLTEAYRTRVADLFAGRKPPDRIRMLDQTLPLRQRAVESHATAVLAAEESLDVAIDLHAAGRGSLVRVLQAMDAQVRQQQVFLASVCRYNQDIADYALTVVPVPTAPNVLAGTLVKQPQPAGQPLPVEGVVPASYEQPAQVVPASAENASPSRLKVAPQPPALVAPDSARRSIPVPPPASLPAWPSVAPSASQPASRDESIPPLAAPQESTIPLPPQPGNTPADDRRSPSVGMPRSAFKPVAESEPADNVALLVKSLYQDGDSSGSTGPSLSLPDCLRVAAADRRLEAIETYWTARRSAADCRLLAQKQKWLDALKPAIAAQDPPSPTAMLDLRSASAAVQAELTDVQADVRANELQLAAVAGLAQEKGPLRLVSLPFAGHFSLRERAVSWPQRQKEAEILRWEQTIRDHAAAATEADTARSAGTADFLAGRAGLDRALAAIDVQAEEMIAFCNALTSYNRSIAQHVVRNSGPSASAESVATALRATP